MVRNLGRFRLSSYIVENNTPHDELVAAVMANCRVLRAEALTYDMAYEYIAISDKFKRVEESDIVPFYRWEIADGELRAV